MTTKEFDEKTLKKLIIDLKDVDNYKSFKHGSFIYDLGYYQGNLLVNEIEKLNNIINGMEKFFQYAYDNECRPLNDRKVSVWTICLNKLQELKDSD